MMLSTILIVLDLFVKNEDGKLLDSGWSSH